MSEQTKNLLGGGYNPDVLECLANLSNDEVFTPPKVVNEMLDMLPTETWSNPNLTFLDPACKTGVFLREIAKRLLVGLEPQMPNLQERIDHIFQKQLYGIAITELTAMASRRSLYCSKYANGKYSVSKFDTPEGNIRFVHTNHTWVGDKCKFCGASADQYERGSELETHAYEFIHTNNPEEIFGMKFDVIIGNPPYQLSLGNDGGNSAKAQAIYHRFMDQSIKMKPILYSMIVPSRWMTKTQAGIPESWVDKMIDCNHFVEIHDFENANECFPGVEIKGGVNYFLYKPSFYGKSNYIYSDSKTKEILSNFQYLNQYNAGVVIRDYKALGIIEKIRNIEGDYYAEMNDNFSGLVSPADFFTRKPILTSNWDDFVVEKDNTHEIKCYLNKTIHKREYGYIKFDIIPKNIDAINIHKVYLPAAGGTGNDSQVLGHPFYGEPGSICSQTYRVIGYDSKRHNLSKGECDNIITYIKTKFFRYLVSVKKKTQNGPRGVYQFVPLQDFNEQWDDVKLYRKYKLTDEEIALIESNIKSMEAE